MSDRLRRATQRASIAFLVLAVAGPTSVMAAGPEPLAPAEDPTPRIQKPGQTAGYRLPFEPGLEVRIDQGWNSSFSHNGRAAFAYDFGLVVGTPVLAAAPGVVAYTHTGETACGGPELRLKANYITINHADGSSTHYGHLSKVGVEVGDVVASGQVIGRSGKTGYSQCLAHLHFARQEQGAPVKASLPVYFEGHTDRELRLGEYVTAPRPATVCPPAVGAIVEAPTTAPANPKGNGALGPRAGPAAVDRGAAAPDAAAPDAAATNAAATNAAATEATPIEAPLGSFCGTYFGGGFEGPAFFSRQEPFLNYDRRNRGPGGYWLDDAATAYSARWSGRFTFASSGTYTFGIVATGGVRVWIDGARLMNRWIDRGRSIEVVLTRNMGAGIHEVVVEHFSAGGPDVLKVGWGRLFKDE